MKADFNTRNVQLKHFHYDTFEWSIGRAGAVPLKACFRTDWMGHLDGFSLQLEPMTEPIWFTRLPEPALTDPAVLRGYTGCYVWNEKPARVDSLRLNFRSVFYCGLPAFYSSVTRFLPSRLLV